MRDGRFVIMLENVYGDWGSLKLEMLGLSCFLYGGIYERVAV